MKKDIVLFVSIFTILLLISGGTYAYWVWNSGENEDVVFNTSKGIEDYIVYDEGYSHFVGDFQPSTNYCGGMSNTLSFYKKSEVADVGLVATLNMDINSIESNTASSSAVYWVLTSGDSSSCTGNLSDAVAYGTFNGKSSGSSFELLVDEEITTSTKTFTVWIWINSAGSNLSSLSGETIDVNIWSQIDMLDVSPDASSCVIYYVDDSDNTTTSQSITEGQAFTIPEYYTSVYTFDEANACANQVYSSGDSVTLSCGTTLYIASGAAAPPEC